jgi:hypothetical protein
VLDSAGGRRLNRGTIAGGRQLNAGPLGGGRTVVRIARAIAKGTVCLSAIILVACAAPVRTYEGAQLPAGQAATLETTGKNLILAIDGREVTGSRFELAPGKHAVLFQARQSLGRVNAMLRSYTAEALCGIWFEALAGRSYQLASRLSFSPLVREADIEKETIVRAMEIRVHDSDSSDPVDARIDCKPIGPNEWRVGWLAP